MSRRAFDGRWNEMQAKKVVVGDTVNVVRGTKVPKGSVGKCFWVGTRRNFYTYRDEKRVGVEIDGERVFLPLDYVEVVDWQSRLITGNERRRRIRNDAVRNFPISFRHLFEDTYYRGKHYCW